jgi:Txe/YoeB family toxin of Txe-Axe toxin-antitoxin module
MAEKKFKVVLTDQMLDALEECLNFLQEDLELSAEMVEGIGDKIIMSLEPLQYQAYIGQIEPYLIDIGKEYRRLIYSHYKIIYRVDNDYVYVVDVFDTNKNPDKMRG